MEVRFSAHSAYRLQYHIVWACKYRRRILKPGVREYLHKVLLGLLRSMSGVEIEMIGFDGDHLHMVMVIPPKYSIAVVMGELKSRSSSRLRKKVCLVGESVLEREYCLVTGILRQQRRYR